jgi:hypothetical protein
MDGESKTSGEECNNYLDKQEWQEWQEWQE